MSHIDNIARLIDQAMVGAAASPMAANVAAYVHSLLDGADESMQVGELRGNTINLTVNQNGVNHSYQVTIKYAGSEQPDTP